MRQKVQTPSAEAKIGEPQQLYTTQHVAKVTALHPESVRRCIRQGRIHAVKFGDDWRITGTELARITAGGI